MEDNSGNDNSLDGSSYYMSPNSSFSELYSTASAGSDTPDKEDAPKILEIEEFDKNLPDTVTLLVSPTGAKIYVVGTGHFSVESQNDVTKVIEIVKPHAIVVELCKGRANIMEMDEESLLRESKTFSFDKMKSIFQQAGAIQGLMYILLLKLSTSLTRTYGIAPGGEFRTALREMKKLKQCVLFYGDRPLRITIKRALSQLSLIQLTSLFITLFFTKSDDISLEEIEKYKQKDILLELTQTLINDYPELSEVLIKERDIYLTHSLQFVAAKQFMEPEKGGTVPTRVVGIVGIGHSSGISKYWGKVTDDDVQPLMIIPKSTMSVRIASFTFKWGVTVLVVYGCIRIFKIHKFLPSVISLHTIGNFCKSGTSKIINGVY